MDIELEDVTNSIFGLLINDIQNIQKIDDVEKRDKLIEDYILFADEYLDEKRRETIRNMIITYV